MEKIWIHGENHNVTVNHHDLVKRFGMSVIITTFFLYYLNISEGNKTGVASRAGTTYLSEAPEFTSVFTEVRVTQSSVFNTVSLFVLFFNFSFGHFIGCPSNFCFKLSLRYLETFLSDKLTHEVLSNIPRREMNRH